MCKELLGIAVGHGGFIVSSNDHAEHEQAMADCQPKKLLVGEGKLQCLEKSALGIHILLLLTGSFLFFLAQAEHMDAVVQESIRFPN